MGIQREAHQPESCRRPRVTLVSTWRKWWELGRPPTPSIISPCMPTGVFQSLQPHSTNSTVSRVSMSPQCSSNTMRGSGHVRRATPARAHGSKDLFSRLVADTFSIPSKRLSALVNLVTLRVNPKGCCGEVGCSSLAPRARDWTQELGPPETGQNQTMLQPPDADPLIAVMGRPTS